MKEHIFWYENGLLYRATYFPFLERITVRKIVAIGNRIIHQSLMYVKINVTPVEWKVFKLGVIKCQTLAQDVEKK